MSPNARHFLVSVAGAAALAMTFSAPWSARADQLTVKLLDPVERRVIEGARTSTAYQVAATPAFVFDRPSANIKAADAQ